MYPWIGPATVLALALVACGGGRVNAPPPARPIAAEPEPPARPASEVCGELLADLDRYEACVDDDQKPLIRAWHERATIDFTALAHPDVTEADRAASARACSKASAAVKAAVARCQTAKR
jgi:hypothetical protein